MLVIGIDPSSGAKSAVGFAAFDSNTKELHKLLSIKSKKAFEKDVRRRISRLAFEIELELSELYHVSQQFSASVFCESTVMRGKGGESLARATGAFMAAVPMEYEFDFVNNGTVKKLVAGHGKAEKLEVALAVYAWFEGNDRSQAFIKDAIEKEKWDALDALAIGIAGISR